MRSHSSSAGGKSDRSAATLAWLAGTSYAAPPDDHDDRDDALSSRPSWIGSTVSRDWRKLAKRAQRCAAPQERHALTLQRQHAVDAIVRRESERQIAGLALAVVRDQAIDGLVALASVAASDRPQLLRGATRIGRGCAAGSGSAQA